MWCAPCANHFQAPTLHIAVGRRFVDYPWLPDNIMEYDDEQRVTVTGNRFLEVLLNVQEAQAVMTPPGAAVMGLVYRSDSGSHKVHPLCEKQPRPGW